MVRNAKILFHKKLSDKFKSHKLCWSTLKYFINSNSSPSIPPLEYNNSVLTADTDKANVLNMYCKRQTILIEDGAFLPDIQPAQVEAELDRIVLVLIEVQLILETLPLGKASEPNGLSNRILRELAVQDSSPNCSLFNQSLRLGVIPKS